MNTTKLSAIATLLFFGANTAGAETTPAWIEQGFIMEEVVVTAEAPAHLYMEEIVVTRSSAGRICTWKRSSSRPKRRSTRKRSRRPRAGLNGVSGCRPCGLRSYRRP